MKDCARIAPLIGAHEGDLSKAERATLAAHLDGCPRCRAIAGDFAATEGLVGERLMARASTRDFAPFVDQVMERVYGRAAPRRAGVLGRLNQHWKGTIAGFAPALAALAVFMYVRWDGGRSEVAALELSSEGNVTMVLQTSDGPVVLLADEESGS
jgi:anti-sigma factor RsiW